ncbi:MAG TPA: hypothetical protein VLI55_02445 [Bryobacteraceae bacterium]|nr:hypothetical protein [Bryobacteraceae bacterium]
MPTNSDDLPVTRAELKAELAAAVERLKEYIDERTHDAETRLLRGFADTTIPPESASASSKPIPAI